MQMSKLLLYLILFQIAAGGCNSKAKKGWDEISKTFAISEENHLVGPDLSMPQPLDRRLEALPDVPLSISRNLHSASDDIYKAAFRKPIGKNSWQLLIYLIGPGEASSSLRYYAVAYDTLSDKWGPEMVLTESYGDGDIHSLESWLVDLDHDGTIELVQRYLSYSVPDLTAEEPWQGFEPNWQTTILEFDNGKFAESNQKYAFDSLQFSLKAERIMRQAYLEANRIDMLPARLR